MRLMSLFATLGLVACVNPLNFDTQVASALCDKLDECGDGEVDAQCEDAPAALLSCYEEHCKSFGLSEANSCVKALNDADCGSTPDLVDAGCLEVWSDCSNLELLACQASAGFGQ